MRTFSKISYFLVIFTITLYGRVAFSQENYLVTQNAQNAQNVFQGSNTSSMMNSFVEHYMGFSQLGGYVISLLMAIVFAMIIAFHPQTFGKKENIEEIEAPKTFLFYAMIGSLVGATVADYGPELGFIFFGLGGLMRFRTNVGNSTQTGRLILIALIGLCCGLKMLYIAAVSTLVGWILIYFLERRTIYQIEITGIEQKIFSESIEQYRNALKHQNFNIIIEKSNFKKSKIIFIFSSPSKIGKESLEYFLSQQIPENYSGSIDLEVGYGK